MKKLQNNFTTPEQSKRLLELGIPADSADCYISNKKIFVLHNCTYQENFNDDLDLARLHLIDMPHYIPCWSVGRLIEIAKICSVNKYDIIGLFQFLEDCEDCLLQLIDYFEKMIYDIDFSKLEEV